MAVDDEEVQVNAWASYDQTAVSARNFSNSNDIKQSYHGATHHHLRHRPGRHSLSSITEIQDQPKGFYQSLILERGASAKKLRSSEIEVKKNVLSEAVLDDIRVTFPGFFSEAAVTIASSSRGRDPSINATKDKKFSFSSFPKTINATMPWTQQRQGQSSRILLFFDMCLRGICQIYFQNNPVSGLLFLIGFFVQSSRIAVHGIIGVVSSTLFARLLRFDKGLARSGLFGYNGVLSGLALATFDSTAEKHSGYNATTIIATIFFSATTSILLVMLGKLLVPYKSPPLTLPFNISVLAFLLGVAGMGHVDYGSVRSPALPDYDGKDYSSGISASAFFAGTIRGVGQVCLCDSILAGVLILAGIAVCSRISAIAAIIGSGIGAAVALFLGVPGSQIELGMFGFNPSLTFTAMFMFYAPSSGAAVLGILSSALTVIAQFSLNTALQPLGLPFMTLPFCLVALAFILIQGTTSIVIAVPLASMTTPEDHLKRVRVLWDGFAFLKESIAPESNAPKKKMKRMKSRKMTRSLSQLAQAIDEAEEIHESKRDVTHVDDNHRTFLVHDGCCFGRNDEDTALKAKAKSIFRKLDESRNGQITFTAITDALQVAGLKDEEQLHFASLILSLMDLDNSGTIDVTEFTAFAIVSKSVHVIKSKIAKFFDFVDRDGNGEIEKDEINAALNYLGEPNLTEMDMAQLRTLTNCRDDDESIEIMALINAVTVAKVELFIDVYHFEVEASRHNGTGGLGHSEARSDSERNK